MTVGFGIIINNHGLFRIHLGLAVGFSRFGLNLFSYRRVDLGLVLKFT